MVQLTPPPSGVQDRAVYDYLYQLQEYLGTVLNRLGTGTAATSTEEWTGEGSVSTREWVNKILQDFESRVNTELGDYLTAAAAQATYLSKTDAGSTYLKITDADDTYLSKTDAGDIYLTKAAAGNTYLTQTVFSAFQQAEEDALDELQVEYVLETGTDGSWSWRKWSSGDVELWGRWELTAGQTPGQQTIPWPTGITGAVANVSAGASTGTPVQVENIVPGIAGVSFSLAAGADPTLPAVTITITAHGTATI